MYPHNNVKAHCTPKTANKKITGHKTIYVREQRCPRNGYSVDCPQISFAGKWLDTLGFKARNRVELHHAPGVVIVTTLPLAPSTRKKIEDLLASLVEHPAPPDPTPTPLTLIPPAEPAPRSPWPIIRPLSAFPPASTYPRAA
jgi:hypothetical protein